MKPKGVPVRKLMFCLAAALSSAACLAAATGCDPSVSIGGGQKGIFVAPDGDDAAKGSFEEPVRTLARAVEIAAEPSRRKSARTVYLRGGEYPVGETVKLGPELSGTIVRAYGEERPVLTGAMRVKGFGPVTDAAMKARFPEAVREKVREADVKAQGYRGFEPHAPSGLFYSSAIQKTEPVRRANTLYCGGRRLTPARSPNEGFVRIDEVLDATGHVFRASVPEMAKLGRADAPDLVTCGYYQYFWDDENVSAEVTDPSRGVVKIDWLGGREVKKDQTLFFQNAPALLDRPGEWYLDRTTGKLYVLPPEDADGEYVLAGFAGSFLSLDGCRDVSVMGLTFEYGRGDAVVIRNAERVAFAGNVVRNFGGIGLQATGRDLRIAGNVLHGFGFDAMRVTGGSRETLEPSGIVVEGNDVSDSGFVQRCYTPGILLNGCGTKIVRNRFHDIPSSAMRVEGNDYDIVSNLIERVVTESDDQGGSDTYGNPSYAGTVYRYNVWTDIVPEGVAPCGRAGIRFDDAISNQKVYGNRFHNCSVGHFGGVQIHGGRCNLVSNNLFTACKYGVSVTPWTSERWHAQLDEYRVKRGVRLDSPAYVRRYPGIGRLYDMPMTNTVCCNVMVGVEKDVYSWKLPAETAVWGNGVFKSMPGTEDLKAVAGFEMPPTAEEVGPCPDEPCLKRARRNDAAVAIPCQERAGTPVKTEVLVEFAKSDEHPRNSEGDVVRLRDGRLLVVYSHFYKDPSSKFADGGSDDSSAELVLTESADGGKTWSKMRTAVRKDKGALNVMSASFLRLGDGRLALFYLNKVASADCRPVMVVSSDEGKTWSAPVDCVSERDRGYYILNNARAVRLQSGRIALPLAYHPFDGKRHAEGAFLLCALSDDDGRTWRLSSDRRRGTPPSGAKKLSLQEPGLVELKDGRLMMYARSNERRQWRLFSTDNGEHWMEPEPVTEYATTTFSPVTYARLADGRLVVVFNDGSAHADAAPTGLERRWPLAVGVSSDEGKTWKTKVLEPDDAKGTVHACYTAVREIDGRLVLVYCHRDMLATTRVVSVPLDWLPNFLANSDSTPSKQVILP